jgi:hypothetical protein
VQSISAIHPARSTSHLGSKPNLYGTSGIQQGGMTLFSRRCHLVSRQLTARSNERSPNGAKTLRKNTPQEHSAKTPDSSDSANIGSGHHSSTDKNKPKATDSGLSLTDVAENDLEIFEQRFRD